jgi:hypothetical protein
VTEHSRAFGHFIGQVEEPHSVFRADIFSTGLGKLFKPVPVKQRKNGMVAP